MRWRSAGARPTREDLCHLAKRTHLVFGPLCVRPNPHQKMEKQPGSWEFACGQICAVSSTSAILALLTAGFDAPILAGLSNEFRLHCVHAGWRGCDSNFNWTKPEGRFATIHRCGLVCGQLWGEEWP